MLETEPSRRSSPHQMRTEAHPGDSEKRLERYQPEHSAHAYFQERYAAVERGLSEEIRRRQIDGLLDPKTAPYEAVVMFISLSDELQMRRLIDLSIDMAAALRTAIDSLTRLSVKRAQPTPA